MCSLILLSRGVWAWQKLSEEDLGERPPAEGLTARQLVPPAHKVPMTQFCSLASLCWVLKESKLASLYLEGHAKLLADDILERGMHNENRYLGRPGDKTEERYLILEER